MLDEHDTDVIANLSPRDVANWLKMRGYNHTGPYGPNAVAFRRESADGEPSEIIVPTSSNLTDFQRRMSEVVDDVARAEGRSSTEVLNDLTVAPFDVIRIRLPKADVYGAIELKAGVNLHDEAKNIMVAAANAAASRVPRRMWLGRRSDDATAYLENVRLGQSQRGSFVLTLLSPWGYTRSETPELDVMDSFGRRVTETLARALLATEAAIQRTVTEGVGPLVQAFEQGVSANLCQSIANLSRRGDGVELSVSWSPTRPAGTPPVTVRIRREDADLLSEAAKELGRSEEPDIEPEVQLEGLISKIDDPLDRFDGSAIIEAWVGNRLRRIQVKFGPKEERQFVYNAARDRLWVRVVGDLQRGTGGRSLQLLNPRGTTATEAKDV